MGEQRELIFDAISLERLFQDEEWGGVIHDDTHTTYDFLEYIVKQRNKCWNQVAHTDYTIGYMNSRKALISIAALAVAAIESMDRKYDRK